MPNTDCLINSGTLWVHSGYVASRLAARHDVASLTYPRGLLDPWAFGIKAVRKKLHWTLIGRRILSASSAIVALSPSEREAVRALGITTRIEVIPNGASLEARDRRGTVDPSRFARSAAPRPRRRPYVLVLGRMHAKKGLDLADPRNRRNSASAHRTNRVRPRGPDRPRLSRRIRLTRPTMASSETSCDRHRDRRGKAGWLTHARCSC